MPTYCMPCGEDRRPELAVAAIDGEPMCAMHANVARAGGCDSDVPIVQTAARSAAALCTRGCGQPIHRGSCAGLPRGPRKLQQELRTLRQPRTPLQIERTTPYTPGPRQAKAEIPKPQPAARRRVDVSFTIGSPIAPESVPAKRNALLGRVSAMQPVFDTLLTLPAETPWLPVSFAEMKDATNRTAALRKLAEKSGGYVLEVRSDDSRLQLFFRLERKPEEAP